MDLQIKIKQLVLLKNGLKILIRPYIVILLMLKILYQSQEIKNLRDYLKEMTKEITGGNYAVVNIWTILISKK